jgi:phenylpyruvate tautomerase PptA (4-oxalocrotonate tautomerase family)
MPYINSVVSVKMSQEQKDAVKSKLGQAINEMPGKSEESLMIVLQDEQTIYFRGKSKEKASIVELKMLYTQTLAAKEDFTRKVCEIYSQELGIPGEDIFVAFTESEKGNWGWNGKLV